MLAPLLWLAAACPGDDGSPDPTGADPETSAGPGPGTSTASTSGPDPDSTSADPSSTSGADTTDGDDTTTGGPLPGTVLDSACEPGAAEVLVETLQIPSDGTEITSLPLAAGSIYRVEVLGTYVWGGCDPGGCPGGAGCGYQRFGDAEVQSDDCWQTAFHDQAWSVITLHVDDQDLDWRRYGTDEHHYARVHDGDGSPLRFRIHDFCEGCYLDNSGELEVRIWELPDDPRVWPNAMSCANSDPWLVDNHELVQTLRPRVLALNYDNSHDNAHMLGLANDAITAMSDGSRYHGWDPASTAVPALQYEVALDVDLRDGTANPNGAQYPHEDPVQGGVALDYGRLFTDAYAPNFGVLDPDDDTRYLGLCELLDRGMVHEVWLQAFPAGHPNCGAGLPSCGLEVIELKPRYDEDRVRLDLDGDGAFTRADLGRCAGNGCADQEDLDMLPESCSRSVRVAYIDSTRGPGCLTHSLSHGIEGTGTARYDGTPYVPYLQQYFPGFAGFDLDARYGSTFDSWYGVCQSGQQPDCLDYPSTTSAQWTQASYDGGTMMWSVVDSDTILDYDPVCGNMHFPPNATGHYDWTGPDTVMTSCTSYRMGNGPGGTDLTAAYDPTVLSGLGYDVTYHHDCEGPWNVWWRQNFPGHQNLAWDEVGYPMLSWWPFLFY